MPIACSGVPTTSVGPNPLHPPRAREAGGVHHLRRAPARRSQANQEPKGG
jgi:hypothetical protein